MNVILHQKNCISKCLFIITLNYLQIEINQLNERVRCFVVAYQLHVNDTIIAIPHVVKNLIFNITNFLVNSTMFLNTSIGNYFALSKYSATIDWKGLV